MTTETVKTGAAGMEEFQETPYYQGLGIEQLQEQLAGYQQDDAQLQQLAEAQYRPAYEAELEAMRHELEQQAQSYGSQLESLGETYDRQRRKTNQAFSESAVNLNNALTKRGLGRSSLVSTQGAYLENQRNQALSEIDRDESSAIQAINERIALLTDQAAQRERTLAGNYARQLENRIGELKAQNQTAAVSLQLQIAALQQQGYEAYQDWLLANRKQELQEKELAAKYPELFGETGGASGGSSSSSSSSGGSKEPEQKNAVGGALAGWLDSVGQMLTGKSTDAQKEQMKNRTAATGKKRIGRR